jgi:sensor histidine kinase YesM
MGVTNTDIVRNAKGGSAAGGAKPSVVSRRLPFLGIVALWTLFGLWTAQQNVLLTITSGGTVASWTRPFEVALVSAWFWALVTIPLMWNTRRLRDRVEARGWRIAGHLVSFAVFHLVDVVFYSTISAVLQNPVRPFVQLLVALMSFNALTYAVIVTFTTALDYHDAFRERAVHAAQLETQLALAQFQVLRAQLQPHFLFNSLNAISALMHKDVGRADRMLARLSEVLRMAIDTAATPEIRLIDEVEFAKRYLETEQMRFGERLEVRAVLPVETYEALVPTMLLQPLVENAVRHGVAPHAGRACVEIRAERHGSRLGIIVSDTGKGLDAHALNGNGREGVGLRTTRERLERLYGAAQELALVNLPGGGFETRVVLPFRRREEARNEDPVPHRG